jgi:tRNA-specific adenosine deaminase 3
LTRLGSIVKPIIPSGGKHPSFGHFRRVCTLSHLPEDLTWRRDYDSRGLQTSFLLVPNTVVPWEDIKATFEPHIDVEGLPRCFDAVVPRHAPLSAEQAALWTERYWPSIYNPAAQVIQDCPPLHHLRRTRAALEVPATDKYMELALTAAAQSTENGHGRGVGAVVVDPETNTIVAVAGDARWWYDDTEVIDPSMEDQGEGKSEWHAVMRAVAMVANKELRRRIAAGGHLKFKDSCTETPSGRSLTPIESHYEEGEEPLRDLTAGLGNLVLDNNTPDPPLEKRASPRGEGYLCSGLDLYLTHEPCVCCAMAMIHSRFRACVFARRMPGSGGLCAEPGNNRLAYGLFWRRELNWRVMTFQHAQLAARVGEESRMDTEIFHA